MPGPVGPQGEQGIPGETGPQGPTGEEGQDGVSIINTYIDENGDLIIEYSNGESSNAGHVKDTNKHTVNFYLDDTLLESRQVLNGTKIARPDFSTPGYSINDWFVYDGDIREKWSFIGYVVTEDLNLYADYTFVNYTVSFVDELFGSPVSDIMVTYHSPFELPVLNHTGYDFTGWFTKSEEQIVSGEECPICSDITLYAKWNVKKYNVSFDQDYDWVSINGLDSNNKGTYGSLITVLYDNNDHFFDEHIFKGIRINGGTIIKCNAQENYVDFIMPNDDVAISVVIEDNWTTEIQNIMKENFYGVVIPFIETNSYEYYDGWDCIYFYGDEVNPILLSDYAKKFEEAEIWTGGFGEDSVVGSGYCFYTKVLKESGAPIELYCYFSGLDPETDLLNVNSGPLFVYLYYSDRYLDEWPTEHIEECVRSWSPTYFGELPYFYANYYLLMKGQLGNKYNSSITGYGITQDPTSEFESLLDGWTFDKTHFEDNYALSSDQKFGLYYKYNSSDKTFYFKFEKPQIAYIEWPSSAINTIVESYSEGEVVPTISDNPYNIYIDYYLFKMTENEILIKVDEDYVDIVLNNYKQVLDNAWIINDGLSDNVDNVYTSPNLNIDMCVRKYGTQNIILSFCPHQPTKWFEYNNIGNKDSLPSAFDFTSIDQGYIDNSMYPYNSKRLIYQEYILASGWNEDSVYFYKQNNKFMFIKISSEIDYIDYLDYYGEIYEKRYPQQKLDEIHESLIDLGFTYESVYDDYRKMFYSKYISPNNEFEISIYQFQTNLNVFFNILE